jgi:hypothetical protein
MKTSHDALKLACREEVDFGGNITIRISIEF